MQAIMQQARVTVHTETHQTAVVSSVVSLFLIVLFMLRCFYSLFTIFAAMSVEKYCIIYVIYVIQYFYIHCCVFFTCVSLYL